MRLNIRNLFLSILDGIMFISSLILKYNDYTKTYYVLSFLSYILLIYLIVDTIRKAITKTAKVNINKILRENKELIVYVDEYEFGKKKLEHLEDINKLKEISIKNKKPIIYYKKKDEHIFLVETNKIYVYKIESRWYYEKEYI